VASKDHHAGVLFPPPVAFATFFGLGWLLHLALPIPVVESEWRLVAAATLGTVGLAFAGSAAWSLLARKTALLPHHSTTALNTSGFYRITRNPIYLGLLLLYVAGSLALNTVWPLLLTPTLIFAMNKGVIEREERYLHALFGEAYADYRRRVRRWL
jgi:protein-S-isoprenylcysteine O-methyltransferase Ste14